MDSQATSFLRLVNERYSCRDYADTPLPEGLVEAVIEAGRLAPSACNRQPWEFLIAQSDGARALVAECYDRAWVRTAPVYIVVVGIHSQGWHRPADDKDHTDIDAAIACEHICLAAASFGLGSCWICNFDAKKLAQGLVLPADCEPVAIIPLGFPAEGSSPQPKNRKPYEEIARWI